MQRMAHHDGEQATAKAAARQQTLMTLSSWSTTSVEDVMNAAPNGPKWFQLYVYKDRWANSMTQHFRVCSISVWKGKYLTLISNDFDRELTAELARRAERAGYKALAITVDTPVLGRREADVRNRFKLPPHLTMANFVNKGGSHAEGTKDGGKDSVS